MYPGVCVRVPRHGSRKFIPAGYIEAAVKQSLGPPRRSTTGDTRDTRFPVGFTLLLAFLLLLLLLLRRPRGRGIRFSEPRTPTLRLLRSLRLRTWSLHFRPSLPGAIDTDVINVDSIRRSGWALDGISDNNSNSGGRNAADRRDKNRWRFMFDFFSSSSSIVGDLSIWDYNSNRAFYEERRNERVELEG